MGITFGKDKGNGHEGIFEKIEGTPQQFRSFAQPFRKGQGLWDHVIQIWYWKRPLIMTSAYLGSLSKSWKELKPSYVLMWQGLMKWSGATEEALGYLFNTLQDKGTEEFFTQAEVDRKLQPHPHTSMSVGDVVRIDDKFYLCLSRGWEELEA